MCEWINTKSFSDIYEFGTCWILQLPAPHHIHFKPLAGRDQIFSFGILLAPGVVASDRGAVQFLCLVRGKTKTFSYWDCRLSALATSPRVNNCWTAPSLNRKQNTEISAFHFLPVSDFSFFSREFSPSPPLCLPSSLKSCEEKQAKSGKMCSHLTHVTLVSSITQSH